MPITTLYQKIINGGFHYFGNALGLTKGVGAIVPGTIATQGAFMTVDTTTSAGGSWPMGTTLDWKMGSSAVYVDLPADGIIDEAFLIWGGSVGTNVTSAARLFPIYLITPDSVQHTITPSQTLNGAGFYSSSANVTTIVSNFTSGNFICGSVPANITDAATAGEGGGWLLAFAVKSNSGGYNYSTLCISNDNYLQVGSTIPIVTPASGTVRGKLMTAVIHASCTRGDALILDTTQPFSAPNREAPNFFNSIISNNSGDGLPYTNATFGNNNNNPSTRSNILNGRQGLDLAIYATNGNIPPNSLDYYMDGYAGGIAFNPIDSTTNYIAYGTSLNPSNATTTLEKLVDKNFSVYNDTLTYTLRITLSGSGSISNLRLFDPAPDNTTFVPSSVYVNGINNSIADLSSGLLLRNTVTLPYSTTITYQSKILNSGSFSNIANNFYVTFTNPIVGGTIFTNTIASDFVLTTILNTANISLNKSVDKQYASIGSILTYTITLNNSGNISADTATFLDTLPNDTTLIANSLFVDNVANPSMSNPININLLPFDPQVIKTITFKLQVINTIPSPNPILNIGHVNYSYTGNSGLVETSAISNQAITTINYAKLNTFKKVDKPIAQINDILTYTISIGHQLGNMPGINVTFIDTLPSYLTLVPNSLLVNNVVTSGSLSAPGINIGTIPINTISTVTFKVVVNTLPNQGIVPDSAYIRYNYIENPSSSPIIDELNTNTVVTTIVYGKLTMNKLVNKSFSTTGNTLTYTLIINNAGNTDITNLLLTDTLPTGTSMLPNSTFIDGVITTGDIESGLPLPTISPGYTTTITFSVLIN